MYSHGTVTVWPLDMSNLGKRQTSQMPQKCRRQQPGPAQNKIVGSANDADGSTHNNFELHVLSTSKVNFYEFRHAMITWGICPQKIKKYNYEFTQNYNTRKTVPFIDLLDHMHMHNNFGYN